MKLTININPFRSKKSRSVSRSDPQSFSSGSSGSSSSDGSSGNLKQGLATPTSVLHPAPGYWSDFSSSDLHYDLFQAFKLVDKDGDGKITTDELQTILSHVVADNPNERDIMLMLADIDAEGEGSVSLEKLGEISSAFGPACGSELRDAFDIFDADRDGKISAEELLQVFSAIGDDRCTLEDCRRMIAGVDSDGDGFVCFEDFSRMMMREQQRH